MTREARAGLAFLAGLIVVGTFGYRTIEGWSVLDSLYMTLITVSTVGFGEPRPLSPTGKLFTGGLILVGVGSLAYIVTRTTEALLERRLLRTRRQRRELQRMRDHVIVCGYGRMGATVAGLLRDEGRPVVVLDRDDRFRETLEALGLRHVFGDATDDAVLAEAGVERARALATVLPKDADNLFVTLTARQANPGLTIITRSSLGKNDRKMIAAGATRVLNPYEHGGRLMAQQLLQPSVTEFIEVVTRWGAADLRLEEVQLEAGSPLAGLTLRDAPLRKELDVIVVGVRRADGGLRFNPPHDLTLLAGDILIVLGARDSLHRLARIAAGRTP